MRESLIEIIQRICVDYDPATRAVKIYSIYDRYFRELRDEPVTLLELGVHNGESLKVWASYFQRGTIIGVDIQNRADFSDYPNIIFEQCDQADGDRLREVCLTHTNGTLDIVIDDAAHVGSKSGASYVALFPLLKSGGFYVVEDWGTGYFDDWPDGKQLDKLDMQIPETSTGKRIPSHDYGMVGFVKSLVDEVAGDNVRTTLTAIPTRGDTLAFIHFYKETVIIKKIEP